jgi:hypothetical protein
MGHRAAMFIVRAGFPVNFAFFQASDFEVPRRRRTRSALLSKNTFCVEETGKDPTITALKSKFKSDFVTSSLSLSDFMIWGT